MVMGTERGHCCLLQGLFTGQYLCWERYCFKINNGYSKSMGGGGGGEEEPQNHL